MLKFLYPVSWGNLKGGSFLINIVQGSIIIHIIPIVLLFLGPLFFLRGCVNFIVTFIKHQRKNDPQLILYYLSSCRSCIPCILALSAVFTYCVIKVFPGLDCCTLISLSDSLLSLYEKHPHPHL